MRYAEWCIAAPSLEADIAAAAMGLDDIGHSRVLYGSLRELGTPDGQEERYHYLHGRSWMREANAAPAVERAWGEALEWFGPESGDVDGFKREGKLAYGVRDLRRMLQERVGDKLPETAIDWTKWDGTRRRSVPGGIDQATLEMLQGLAEKRYMPTSG